MNLAADKTLAQNIKEALQKLNENLAQLTPNEMDLLLNTYPLKAVCEKEYGSTNMVTYEAIVNFSDGEELKNRGQHNHLETEPQNILQGLVTAVTTRNKNSGPKDNKTKTSVHTQGIFKQKSQEEPEEPMPAQVMGKTP